MDPVTIALTLASQFAPGIIKYFTASETAASVAGQVIGIAQTVTGKGSPAEASEAMIADPALAQQFRLALLANDLTLEQAFLADRQSARSRDIAITQSGRYNYRADVLAVLAVGGLMTCMWFIARDASMPERSVNAIIFVAGVLAAAVRDVFSFEFGSSKSSKDKDEVIRQASQR